MTAILNVKPFVITVFAAVVLGTGFFLGRVTDSPRSLTVSADHVPTTNVTDEKPVIKEEQTTEVAGDTALMKRFREAYRKGDVELDNAIKSLLPALVRENPAAAMAFAESLEPGAARESLILKVATLWQEIDLGSALKWASQRKDGEAFLSALCLQQAQSNPAQAIASAQLFNLDKDSVFMSSLYTLWAKKNVGDALNWAIALPAGSARESYVSQGALLLASTDPAQAADVMLTEVTPGSRQESTVLSIMETWNRRDWNAAMAWAEQVPKDNPMSGRVKNMVKESLRPPVH